MPSFRKVPRSKVLASRRPRNRFPVVFDMILFLSDPKGSFSVVDVWDKQVCKQEFLIVTESIRSSLGTVQRSVEGIMVLTTPEQDVYRDRVRLLAVAMRATNELLHDRGPRGTRRDQVRRKHLQVATDSIRLNACDNRLTGLHTGNALTTVAQTVRAVVRRTCQLREPTAE